jgi:hypothetical protein
MKQFLPLLFLSISLLSFKHLKAQFVMNVLTVDCSSPNICDGYASIDSTNTLSFSNVIWYMNGNVIQNGGTSIFNLCPGNYVVNATGGGVTLTSPFTIGSSSPNPCASLGMYLTSTLASTQNSCDASITATAYGGTTPYAFQISNTPFTGTNIFDNLCIGTYNVTVSDANGCTLTQSETIIFDTTTTSPCAGFSPSVTVTDCSAPGACDGAIAISCTNCGPYTVMWSQGAISYSISNLCEGTYAAVVTDSNGCTFNTTQYVGINGGGNIDSINVVGNLATGSNITGSLISDWIYNCDIELSMLGTAYMVSASFGNNPLNQDSLYTVWYLADTTGLFTYIDYTFYAPLATGIYNLILQVYCPIKSTPLYFNIISQFDVQSAGIDANLATSLSLSPNPVQNTLQVNGGNAKTYAIFNFAGQCLQSGPFNKQIDVSNLVNGSYLIQINNQMLPFIKM